MKTYIPTEDELTMNPITGQLQVGRSLDKYVSETHRQSMSPIERSQQSFYSKFKRSDKQKMIDKFRNSNVFNVQSQKILDRRAHNNSVILKHSPLKQDPINLNFRANPNVISDQSNSNVMPELHNSNSQIMRQMSPYRDDIDGAQPRKFRHKHKKLFVDRNEARSVFGQRPGKYHGFMNDQSLGGTYSIDRDNKPIVDDLGSYAKFKMFIKDMNPKIKEDGSRIKENSFTYRQPSSHQVKRIVRNQSSHINRNPVHNIGSSYGTVVDTKNKSKLIEMCNQIDRLKTDHLKKDSTPIKDGISEVHRSFDQRSSRGQNMNGPLTDSPYISFKAKPHDYPKYDKLKQLGSGVKNRVKFNDYIAMRNKGYLTSDSLGVNKLTNSSSYY